ncbi:hypothetical protein U9M48_033109 [Paspalum notatum var. saurae]|uniref:adenine phosphoribosyltransferase n=1 Tax=Paspalum notatum var. saurae TaxID=547442 RepID=A0AAQ3X581_PASNO
MGEQENNKTGAGGNAAMAADEAPPSAKEKGRAAADPRLQGISDAIRVVPHFPKPGIMFNDITPLLLRPGVFKDAVDMFVERYRGMRIAAVAAGVLALRNKIQEPMFSVAVLLGEGRGGLQVEVIRSRSSARYVRLACALVDGRIRTADGMPLPKLAGRSRVRVGIEARGFIFGPAIALAIGAKFVPLRKPKKLPGEVFSESYVLEYGTDCLEMHVGAIEPGERVVVVDDLVATGGTLSAAIRLIERAGADVIECACLIGLPKFKNLYKLNGKPVYILVESRK